MVEQEMTDAGVNAQYTPEQLQASLKAEKIRWKNRRQMAWCSLAAMFLQTIILIFAPASLLSTEKIQIIKEPLTWAYMCESAVILAYMGFTTWAYMKDKYSSLTGS